MRPRRWSLMPHAPSSSIPLRLDPLGGSPYAATRRLGEGTAAEVYEAIHVALGKPVVVKVLRAEHAADPRALDRMRFEAQALARLRHPNVTAVTDFGQTPAGRPYFVMERHEGRSLRDELHARGHLPVAEAVALAQQLLAGLEAAHALGVIHRDVKLENLLLCNDGQLKILDFGIAKLAPGADPAQAPAPIAVRTEEGVTLGTPRFLSPEQVMCRPVDRRTDVYGAAMVVYELIAGARPLPRRARLRRAAPGARLARSPAALGARGPGHRAGDRRRRAARAGEGFRTSGTRRPRNSRPPSSTRSTCGPPSRRRRPRARPRGAWALPSRPATSSGICSSTRCSERACTARSTRSSTGTRASASRSRCSAWRTPGTRARCSARSAPPRPATGSGTPTSSP